MNIPDAAIEAAAVVIAYGTVISAERAAEYWAILPRTERDAYVARSRAAIEAAMPAIREALAQEIEAEYAELKRLTGKGRIGEYAARIVRGGAA